MQTIDRHFRDLTKAAFARHGFAQAELLAQWDAIMGEMAACTAPERIRWPKGAGDAAQKHGGTLVLRVQPGHVLDLQYQTPRIIERVNSYLGYGAIAAIKIKPDAAQRPKPKPAPSPLAAPVAAGIENRLSAVADEGLKNALRRLGEGVLALRSPQAK